LGINVPLLRAETPAVAHVMPLTRRDQPHRVSHNAAAAIFIAVSGNAPVPAMDAIGALFGLTPAEKNVAAHIASGKKPAEIAEMSGASAETVKTHIRALFDKTSTHDQRDLILLVKELTPPVRSD
jgi:DNA-binding CsgD family transcriptional regulator